MQIFKIGLAKSTIDEKNTSDPSWGANDADDSDSDDDDDDDGGAAPKKKKRARAKGLSSGKARLMANADVKDLMKLGSPTSSSTKVGVGK